VLLKYTTHQLVTTVQLVAQVLVLQLVSLQLLSLLTLHQMPLQSHQVQLFQLVELQTLSAQQVLVVVLLQDHGQWLSSFQASQDTGVWIATEHLEVQQPQQVLHTQVFLVLLLPLSLQATQSYSVTKFLSDFEIKKNRLRAVFLILFFIKVQMSL
jgi:hypothetical protein